MCLDSTCNSSQLRHVEVCQCVCACVCVSACALGHWHASNRMPLPLQVTPLTSHLFLVGGAKEEGIDGKGKDGERP